MLTYHTYTSTHHPSNCTSTQVVDLNPKAVKTEELYGYISMATREWKDGLLSKVCVCMKEQQHDSRTVKTCIH